MKKNNILMFTNDPVHYYSSNRFFLSCLLFFAGNPMGRVAKAALMKCGYQHVMVGHSQGYMVAHTLSSKPPSQKRELTEAMSS